MWITINWLFYDSAVFCYFWQSYWFILPHIFKIFIIPNQSSIPVFCYFSHFYWFILPHTFKIYFKKLQKFLFYYALIHFKHIADFINFGVNSLYSDQLGKYAIDFYSHYFLKQIFVSIVLGVFEFLKCLGD